MPAVASVLSWSQKLISVHSAILAVFYAATLLLLHHLLQSSPRALWLTANVIVFVIWRLSAAKRAADDPSLPPPDPSSFVSPEAEPPSGCAPHEVSTDATSRPAQLTKSETWERRRQRVGEEATEVGLKKSATFKEKSAMDKGLIGREEVGWRRRDTLVVGREELFGRAETMIKKHHDHLRLQRQESEQRRFLERL